MSEEANTILNYVKNDDIYILGGFDETISQNVIALLPDIINRKSTLRNSEINIYINSLGGQCDVMFSLSYFIKKAKDNGIKVITHIIGNAYSAGSYIAVQGDYRYMNRYNHQLLHFGNAWLNSETPKQLERNNKMLQEHFNNLVDIYAKHTKLTKTQIKQFMNDDKCYLNADECLKYGLIDEII